MSDLGPNLPSELSPQKTYRLMAMVAVAIFLLLGVAIFSLSRLSQAPWSSQLATPKLIETSRQKLPQFEYHQGKEVLNPENFKDRWTLLSFWSFSCSPCLTELPGLNQLAQSWQGPDLNVLTVNIDSGEDLEQAKRFLLEQEITLPTLFDSKGELKSAFQVDAYPRHFLIGPDQMIIWSAVGAYKWNQNSVRDQLLKLMAPEALDQEKSQDQQESTLPE